MIRVLLIIAGLFAIAAGFEWLKDTPGELALTLGGTIYSVGLAEAALALALVAVVSVICYLVFRARHVRVNPSAPVPPLDDEGAGDRPRS